MSDIASIQNTQDSIDKLSAQRHLYSISKNWKYCVLVVYVIIPFVFSIVPVFVDWEHIKQITCLYTILVIVIKPVLDYFSFQYQCLAAKMQQLFDCDIFELDWHSVLCGSKPTYEDICEYKQSEDVDLLHDWYNPNVAKLNHNASVLICQRTNVNYDNKIRKRFHFIIWGACFFIIIGFLILGLFKYSFSWDWLYFVIIPLAPIMSWGIHYFLQSKEAIDILSELQNLVEKQLASLQNGYDVDIKHLQTIQNFIFLNRKKSILIPDWFYRFNRDKYEDMANYAAEKIIDKLPRRLFV